MREALELATHVALIQRGQLIFPGERTQEMLDDTGWLYRTLWGKLTVGFFRHVWTIAHKDLRSELRTKEAFNASFAFSMVILVLFSFAFDPSSEQIKEFSGGLLWMVFSFAGALVLNRSFAREVQNDCLDALIASPIPPAAFFLGKTFANFALLFAVELVSLPVFGLFYDVPWTSQIGWLLLVLVLGTWALTVIGTLFSALHRESSSARTDAADAGLSDDDSRR